MGVERERDTMVVLAMMMRTNLLHTQPQSVGTRQFAAAARLLSFANRRGGDASTASGTQSTMTQVGESAPSSSLSAMKAQGGGASNTATQQAVAPPERLRMSQAEMDAV